MKIGNIELKSNIFAAPMAGYSEAGYRYLAGESGAGLTYTEMISAKGIVYGSEKTFQLLYKSKKDNNKTAVQIFGSEPEFIYKACKSGVFEKFEIIDINMGCPVRKIVNNGDGSKLLENPKLAGEIVRAAIEGSRKPVRQKYAVVLIQAMYLHTMSLLNLKELDVVPLRSTQELEYKCIKAQRIMK